MKAVWHRPGRVAAKAGFDPTSSIGVLAPMSYWDPCGMMKEPEGADGWRWKDEETFQKYRAAELKHGRLSMVFVTSQFLGVPDVSADTWAAYSGNGAYSLQLGLELLFALWIILPAELNTPKGDFNDPLNLSSPNERSEEFQNKELAHCRLGMSAAFVIGAAKWAGALDTLSVSKELVMGFMIMLGIWTSKIADRPQGDELVPPQYRKDGENPTLQKIEPPKAADANPPLGQGAPQPVA
jgi:hypothetical protein